MSPKKPTTHEALPPLEEMPKIKVVKIPTSEKSHPLDGGAGFTGTGSYSAKSASELLKNRRRKEKRWMGVTFLQK